MKKKLLLGLTAVVICFVLVGCGKEEIINNKNSNEQQNETPNNNNSNQQQNEPSNNNIGVGKYKIEKGDNNISVITNDGNGIATTTYYFTNDTISRAELIEEFTSASIAEASYNTMKNEPAIMNSYNDIKLDGKKVILTVKSEVLSAYSTFDYDGFYDLMYSTYEAYMN